MGVFRRLGQRAVVVFQVPARLVVPVMVVALQLLVAVPTARAEKEEIPGWPGLYWGEDMAALDARFGEALTVLAPPWQFGPFEAPRVLPDRDLAGLDFRAYFQVNPGDGRLGQILMERRHAQATPLAFVEVYQDLIDQFGPAARECLLADRGGESAGDPAVAEAIWRFADTRVHLSFLDFKSNQILYQNPAIPIDPLIPDSERRVIYSNLLPRRILIRFYPADRPELDRGLSCDP